MVIQYPNKLDKNRPVYIAMDYTTPNTRTYLNKVVEVLKAGGVTNIKRQEVGPNELYTNITQMLSNKESNAIVINITNGVDPNNLKELGLWEDYLPASCANLPREDKGGNDNNGRNMRKEGNDAIYATFWDGCDFTRSDGTCYNRIKTRNSQTDEELGGYWPSTSGYKPIDYCRDNKIYVVNQSSNNHKNSERADYTGEKVGKAILALFEVGANEGQSTDSTPSESTNTDKTIKEVVTERTYTKAYYQNIFTVKTDEKGGFTLPVALPYAGKYTVNLHYEGDSRHDSSTRTITVDNQRGEIFTEKLLETKTTTTYTDNTVETKVIGSIGNEKHTRTKITTAKYNNGKVESTTETIIDNDTRRTIDNEEETTPTVINDASSDPFKNTISPILVDGNPTPNISSMKTNDNKTFEMVDLNSSYTLTSDLYIEVMNRDSKSMQLNNYIPSKYTAFRCTEYPNKYIVLKREQWNSVEESLMYYMVREGGKKNSYTTMQWPKMKVDFNKKKTYFNDAVEDSENPNKDVWGIIKWKNQTTGECNQWFVADNQNLGYTCGPTSASICTQYLHKYQSERVMQSLVQAGSGSGGSSWGSGAGTNAEKLNNLGFSATVYSKSASAFDWVKEHKPVIYHVSSHYIALTFYSENGDILVCNSTTSSGYGPYTGWRSQSAISGNYGGEGVLVGLNWTITEEEKSRINNFYQSMGGSWNMKEDKSETPRYYQLSY